MKRLPTTRTQRIRCTDSSRSPGPSRDANPTGGRRMLLPHWGDLHPSHRIPTFLESVYFEGDTSATTTARYDT